jgi:hypothetical protein
MSKMFDLAARRRRARRRPDLHPLVVVVDGDGEDLLGDVLADDVVVEELEDLPGLGSSSNWSSEVSVSSSSMISLQRSMHSSQM